MNHCSASEGDLLLQHVRRWASLPFVWGQSDCSLVVADYLLALTGTDCAAHLRGRYDDRESCEALCGWVSDPLAVVEDCFSRIPVRHTETPGRGDPVLARFGRYGVALGLMLDTKVAIKAERGVLMAPACSLDVLGAWAAP